MSDNTPVYMTAAPIGPCGYSEFVVSDEDWVVPVFTKVPPVELSLARLRRRHRPRDSPCAVSPSKPAAKSPCSDSAPSASAAVQGARIQGAKIIIGIDPIKYRRDLAMKLGATFTSSTPTRCAATICSLKSAN